MRNLFLFLKTGILFSAFIFFSAIFNYVSANSYSIESISTTESYIDESNLYNFPIRLEWLNSTSDNLMYEYSYDSWSTWISFTGTTSKIFDAWENINKWDIVVKWTDVITQNIWYTNTTSFTWLWTSLKLVWTFNSLMYDTELNSINLKGKTNWGSVGWYVAVTDMNDNIIGTSETWYFWYPENIFSFNFASPVKLEKNTQYKIKVQRSQYVWDISVSLRYNSSNWQLYYTSELTWYDNAIYKSDINDLNKTNFIWVATQDGTIWSDILIETSGLTSQFSDLISEMNYYLSDIPWNIVNTGSLNDIEVWTAYNSQSLLLSKWYYNNVNLNSFINFTNLPEGDNTINFRIKDINNTYSNQVTLNILKSTLPIIEINNANTELADMKNITASTNIWVLSYAITDSALCDSSLIFKPYTPINLNDSIYNWQKICFMASASTGNTYKFSDVIWWIRWFSKIYNWDVFNNYKNWKISDNIRENDTTLAFLKMMISTSKTSSTSPVTTSYPSSLIDVNWDGLVDMLYSNYRTWTETRIHSSGTYDYTIFSYKYSIMINNWDYSFTPVYRCVQEDWKYYGDCVE